MLDPVIRLQNKVNLLEFTVADQEQKLQAKDLVIQNCYQAQN